MSGTSLDGVDAVLAELGDLRPKALAHVHRPFDAPLREQLLALNARADDEIHRAELAANRMAREYAQAVQALLLKAQVDAATVRAIGAHGQTVRHRPGEFDGCGYTVQLLNGALLAEAVGIDVVCDFRTRDLAAGGQGAPLVPAFHAGLFARPDAAVAVLNIGGIANLTLIGPGAAQVLGLDCGPGNALLDGWCQRHQGHPVDLGGQLSARGRVIDALLQRMLADSFFARRPPKSTGRDLFHLGWVDAAIASTAGLQPPAPADVQATLAQLTARAAGDALRRWAPGEVDALLVCGGGVHNADLMQRLTDEVHPIPVGRTDDRGVPADQVEALAFAWLAQTHVERRPGNLPAVTGARGTRVLGALYPR